jgi:hypothetical protein
MATQALANPGSTALSATRWRVFLVSSSPDATAPDHTWARRSIARRWPNVPATVFVIHGPDASAHDSVGCGPISCVFEAGAPGTPRPGAQEG